MLRVGLTGGLACGKSTVAAMLQRRGAHVLNADRLAHELMQPGTPIYGEVVRRFGRDVVHPDGSINRPALASLAFEHGRVKELNGIVHPAVVERQEDWMREVGQRDPDGIAVVEAALLVEAGVASSFDKLVVVTCRPDQKVERFIARLHSLRPGGGFDRDAARAEAHRRISAQVPDEEKVRLAHFLIDNSGMLAALEPQVDRVWNELRASAAAKKGTP